MERSVAEDEELQQIAESCLAYLISDPEELSRFMQQTGMDPDSVRRSVGSSSLSMGMLDYFAQNEPALLAMCANSKMSTDRVMRMWQRLNPVG
jgi:hypothetical protein